MPPPPSITFVTGNANKLHEVQRLLGPSISVTHIDLDLEEIQGSVEDIAVAKARAAAAVVGGPVLVEDSALEFDALHGMPGPYIKWVYEAVGNEGLCRMLDGQANKKARAVCTFGYCPGNTGKNPPVALFQGTTQGTIVAPRWSPDRVPFGWTPIFQPDNWDLTFAEMSLEQKHSFSARAVALGKFRDYVMKWDQE